MDRFRIHEFKLRLNGRRRQVPTQRNNHQLQSADRLATLTVGQLRAALAGLDDSLPVAILSPKFGAFGSEMPYGIGAVEDVLMPRMQHTNPAEEYENDDGDLIKVEADTQVWPEWRGVVLQGTDRHLG
jgi:hypothetical protein